MRKKGVTPDSSSGGYIAADGADVLHFYTVNLYSGQTALVVVVTKTAHHI